MIKTKAVTKRQKEILLRALKYIKEEPDRLDMRTWGEFHPTCGIYKKPTFNVGYKRRRQIVPPCGTTSCLGGTILLVTKAGQQFIKSEVPDPKKPREVTYIFPYGSFKQAKNILKFTLEQAANLFYFKSWKAEFGNYGALGWPTQFSKAYNQAKNGKERYKALQARVKYFIRTGL